VYNTWFVDNNQRLKAFRTIRRGVLRGRCRSYDSKHCCCCNKCKFIES